MKALEIAFPVYVLSRSNLEELSIAQSDRHINHMNVVPQKLKAGQVPLWNQNKCMSMYELHVLHNSGECNVGQMRSVDLEVVRVAAAMLSCREITGS